MKIPKVLTLNDGTRCCDESCPYYYHPSWSGHPVCKIDYKMLDNVDEVFETYVAHCPDRYDSTINVRIKHNQDIINSKSCTECGELLDFSTCICEYCGDVCCPF